jgi:para-nitrobenzyl esterase
MRIASLSVIGFAAALAIAAPTAAQITAAKVTGGRVEGTAQGQIGVFKGIPFAAPPVGDLRWRDPWPVVPWSGAKQVRAFGPACMQAVAMLNMVGAEPNASEDCLYLNVWTPAKRAGEKLPVMVWIYGGAFVAGATSSPTYDGMHLAERGVVLVSVAYRVGAFGWLAHPELSKEQGGSSGNYGLKDQIAALEWVRDNVAQFGGDPDNVTIFGESAGGISVGMLAVSPPAKGLFAKAISESGGNFAVPSDAAGPGPGTRTLAAAEAAGVKSIEGLGASSLAAARALTADAIMKMQGSNWPIYDGRVLPGDPWLLYDAGRFNDTPILIGTNSDEGGLFIRQPGDPTAFDASTRGQYGAFAGRALELYPASDAETTREAQADMMREQVFAWPTYAWARKQASLGRGAAYVYYFDHKTPQSPRGALHASEIQYVFGTLGTQGGAPTKADEKMRDEFMGYFVNFAKTGDPNGAGLPEWPRFTKDTPRFMALGDTVGPIPVPHRAQYDFWDDYFASQRAEREVARAGEGSH